VNLEASFLDDIKQNPHDQGLWLILADWLQEQPELQQQARAEMLRLLQRLRLEPDHPDQPEWERRLQTMLRQKRRPPVPVLTNSLGMRLALIPAGCFYMGSPKNQRGRETTEDPLHLVEITKPFFLGTFQVTQEEYTSVTDANPSHFTAGLGCGTDYPVERVSWDEAVEFCRRLSQQPGERDAGRTYCLPTEAEWEYACRAGTRTPFWWGGWITSRHANMYGGRPYGRGSRVGPYLQRTARVGSYRPNPWGLFDMHGNVWEWCRDWADSYYYGRSPRVDPQGPDTGQAKILRGGSWGAYGYSCRASSRKWEPTDGRYNYVGFRVACTLAAWGDRQAAQAQAEAAESEPF
jgi:uncharacterized protein (TIGR02996 family)